jgi:hypothetical protein
MPAWQSAGAKMRREGARAAQMVRPATGLMALGVLVFVAYNVLFSPLAQRPVRWLDDDVSRQARDSKS